jgi:ubiquinone/menaquinone biosynthesis C-methylase UbiE
VTGADDIQRFFDALAEAYRDEHGDADRLLRYRVRLIRRLLRGVGRSCLVEVGCGNGLHLFALAGDFERAVGTDLSPRMIAASERRRAAHPLSDRIRFAVHAAKRLSSVPDETADAVLCVGAFEHMLDRSDVLKEIERVLRPGGAFVCLTPNAEYVWYTQVAPYLRLQTRHLSTDRFVGRGEWPALLREADLQPIDIGTWRFVPAGDMPAWAATPMRFVDGIGHALRISSLRGGCYVKAVKPSRRTASMSS